MHRPTPSPSNVDLVAEENRHLLREMFVAIWREHGWPRQAMGFAEWDALAEMLLDPRSPPRTLPGGIVAQHSGAADADAPVMKGRAAVAVRSLVAKARPAKGSCGEFGAQCGR